MRISSEVIAKVKQLEIFTRRLLNGAMVGDSRSAIKGSGFEFDQIRGYTFGDDIRFIDWKASARNNTLLVKQYIEERSRTIYLLVDISKSSFFGSRGSDKWSRIAEIASILSLVAYHGKDQVGLVLFSDQVELMVSPSSSLSHIHMLIETLLTTKPKQSQTNISAALKYFLSLKKQNGIVFLISDFIDDAMDAYLSQVAKRFDTIAIRCLDPYEKALPSVGFITVQDVETGLEGELDIRKKKRDYIKAVLSERLIHQDRLFKRNKIDLFQTPFNGDDYIVSLVRFFRQRMMY